MSESLLVSACVEAFYEDVEVFNDTAGNLSSEKLNKASLRHQLELIQEELTETFEALESGNHVGLLDGVVDVLVTAFGFAQKLDAMGFDVGEAMMLISQNNLSKFPMTKEEAEETVAMHAEDGVECTYHYNEKHRLYVVKDVNGKVRKPYNYESVNINHCVPF